MPLELNNATYKAFTDFASQAKVSDRTIASIDDKNLIKNESNLDSKTIVASKNWDFIGNIGRFADKQKANNDVRALFRQSIIDMFGGEALIPESVKTAMKLEDYGKGKPLSARRIRIVKAAIDAVKDDMKPIKMDKATAQKMLKESETFLGVSLDVYNEANDIATNWLVNFGQGMPAKTARLLSNYIVGTIIYHAEDVNITLDETKIKKVAEEMKTWDEFIFDDKRTEDIGKEFMKRHNKYIQEKFNKPEEFMSSNPDVFKMVDIDAHRFDWNINGKKLPLGTKKETVIDAFCQAVPNFFVSYDLHEIEQPISKVAGNTFDLKISEDGKTATVTVTPILDLCINTAQDKYRIGKANIAIQSTFDLTKDIPEITNVTFSQTFSPNEIYNVPTKK